MNSGVPVVDEVSLAKEETIPHVHGRAGSAIRSLPPSARDYGWEAALPLGYEKDERTLRINEAEAETVRTLYAVLSKNTNELKTGAPGPSPSFIYHYDGERNHQGLGNAFVFLDTTALAMLCRSVLSSAEYHNRKETEIGTVSLKKGALVDFEAHLVGRSRECRKAEGQARPGRAH